jgi:ADP-dependent NAD(P)H-hydrate dehydratase / NAD(P)H-hydrate epimerase
MPLPVISVAQMRAWEKATWAAGQTEAEVIRQVGLVVARFALALTPRGGIVLILAGKGHNGEDARCARDHLPERRVEVLDVTEPEAALGKLEALLSLKPALVVDGLFGIGLNRSLSADWISFIEKVNAAEALVLSVDVPSGLNAETGEPEGAAVKAAVTLTVGAPKRGMLRWSAWPFVGRMEVASEVGLVPCPFSSEVTWTVPGDFVGFPPVRSTATHKGTYGHLAIIAGSVGYHGAAVLCSRGAQRAQPGLITLHVRDAIYPLVASQLQAVMVRPLETAELQAFGAYDAALIGPGLAGPDVPEQVKKLIRDLWLGSQIPVIVDASALDWLPPGAVRETSIRVITPHPGEAARLLGISVQKVQTDRVAALRELSKRFGNTWVALKGHQTLIGRSSGPICVNSSGNPHLAQGGSGDVLAGYLAGLLAQSNLRQDPSRAIRYAVWQHGAAADFLQASHPNWVVEELVDVLGSISPQACNRKENPHVEQRAGGRRTQRTPFLSG